MAGRTETLLAAALLLATSVSLSWALDEVDICLLMPNGTTVRSPTSCQGWARCINGKSIKATCINGFYYSKEQSKCVRQSDVVCELDVDTTCLGKPDKSFVEDPESCNGYFYCNAGVAEHSHCPSGLNFEPVTTSCQYESVYNCRKDEAVRQKKVLCNYIPNLQLFDNPMECNGYHFCVDGALLERACPGGLAYNKETGQCDAEENVLCAKEEEPIPTLPPRPEVVANTICGNASHPIQSRSISDGVTCRGYYYCKTIANGVDIAPEWLQCVAGQTFDKVTATCRDRLTTKCEWDRCDGMGNKSANLNNDGCRGYSSCMNDKLFWTAVCPNEMYFDEKNQKCTKERITYQTCKTLAGTK